jgi:phosphate transport system protein
MKTHRPLDDELRILWDLLVRMSEVVDEQLADAIDALSNCDLDLAERVRDRDDEVDALELQIDHQCERILALHTPVAVDLRLLITAVKVNTDLERIGDHAKNLAKNTPFIAGCSDLLDETRIPEMADTARRILHEVQDAFMKRDRVLARKVIAHDLEIDRLHKETIETLVRLTRENPENTETLVHLVTMSKAIERVADHAKNIAESVVFLIEGVDIRHRKLPQEERP